MSIWYLALLAIVKSVCNVIRTFNHTVGKLKLHMHPFWILPVESSYPKLARSDDNIVLYHISMLSQNIIAATG